MKKLMIIATMLILPLTIAGCGCNKVLIDLNYEFSHALVNENGTWVEYEITKWNDYDNDAICIWTKDGQMIYGSLNNITRINK